MNPNRKKYLIVTSLVLLYLVTGFFREFIFTNINEQLRVSYYKDPVSHVSHSMLWLANVSYYTLYYVKWPLTLCFTLFFAFLSATTIRIAFNDKSLVRICWITYGIVFLVGFLFFLAGPLIGNSENTYEIARFLAGLTETPALLVILSASFLALRRV